MIVVCFCSTTFDNVKHDRCPYCGEEVADRNGWTDCLIADHLRAATRAKLIEGWYHTGALSSDTRQWVVNTADAGASEYMDRAGIVSYVEMLRSTGIEPEPIRWPA